MTVNLPEPLAAIVRQRVESAGYASPEDYFAALINADQEQRRRAANGALGITDDDRAHINTLLDEALDDPRPPVVPGPDYKEELLRRAQEIAGREI